MEQLKNYKMTKDKWSKENWDKSLDKVKALLAGQCPEAKCEVWLKGSATNDTSYCDNLHLNVRVEFDYSIEKYYILINEEAMKHIDNTE